jgi:ribosome-binding protein aMBF1 (putative translation factor)
MKIITTVKDLRRELGWTQFMLATELRISQSMVARYEIDLMPSIWVMKRLTDLGKTRGIKVNLEEIKSV